MNKEQHIPQGYKDSPLGVIPQEWEVRRLGEVCDIDKKSLTSKTSPNYEFDYISLSDVDSDSFEITTSRQVFVNAPSRARRIVNKGDVIMSTVRPNLQGFAKIDKGVSDLIVSTGFAVLTPKKCKTDYIFPYLFSDKISKQFYTLVVGSNYPAVNSSDVANLKIAIPPLEEQKRIAEVLGVWDEAIERQTKMVALLETRKRALMQRLLTPKPHWKTVSYSEILKEVKRQLKWNDNELYRLISVKRRSGGLFERESLYGREIKTKNLRPAHEGDFLISKMQIVHGASGLTTCEFHDMKISGSYIALIARNANQLDMNYFNWWSKVSRFYHQTYISSFGVHIEKMTFDLGSFMALGVKLPPLSEQEAIAEKLSTADVEIDLAKRRLDFYRTYKRALMQQLLTGKKRLKFE